MKQGLLFLILGCFLMTDASAQGGVQAGSSKQIWLGGVDPVAQSDRHTDGNAQSSSDKQWIEQALGHYKDITGNPATAVDDLVFQTWSPRPAKMLPETDPGRMDVCVEIRGDGGEVIHPTLHKDNFTRQKQR